jgi:hypothetical protein
MSNSEEVSIGKFVSVAEIKSRRFSRQNSMKKPLLFDGTERFN